MKKNSEELNNTDVAEPPGKLESFMRAESTNGFIDISFHENVPIEEKIKMTAVLLKNTTMQRKEKNKQPDGLPETWPAVSCWLYKKFIDRPVIEIIKSILLIIVFILLYGLYKYFA